MNNYFIAIAAILTVDYFYKKKVHNPVEVINTDIIHNNCMKLTSTSSDNLHKEGWNNNDKSCSQNKW